MGFNFVNFWTNMLIVGYKSCSFINHSCGIEGNFVIGFDLAVKRQLAEESSFRNRKFGKRTMCENLSLLGKNGNIVHF